MKLNMGKVFSFLKLKMHHEHNTRGTPNPPELYQNAYSEILKHVDSSSLSNIALANHLLESAVATERVNRKHEHSHTNYYEVEGKQINMPKTMERFDSLVPLSDGTIYGLTIPERHIYEFNRETFDHFEPWLTDKKYKYIKESENGLLITVAADELVLWQDKHAFKMIQHKFHVEIRSVIQLSENLVVVDKKGLYCFDASGKCIHSLENIDFCLTEVEKISNHKIMLGTCQGKILQWCDEAPTQIELLAQDPMKRSVNQLLLHDGKQYIVFADGALYFMEPTQVLLSQIHMPTHSRVSMLLPLNQDTFALLCRDGQVYISDLNIENPRFNNVSTAKKGKTFYRSMHGRSTRNLLFASAEGISFMKLSPRRTKSSEQLAAQPDVHKKTNHFKN